MKKRNKLLLYLCLLCSIGVRAQSCLSSIQLTVNTGFTPIDSTNLSQTYYIFTATSTQHSIRFWVKGSNTPVTPAIFQIYNNNCGSLSTNIIGSSLGVNQDTFYVDMPSLTVGNRYLIELTNYTGSYLVNRISIGNSLLTNTAALSCPTGSAPCQGSQLCDLVCNGGFECLTSPVNNPTTNVSGIQTGNAWNWNCPTGGSADLFTATSIYPSGGVPCNFSGSQNAHTGGNYAGIIWSNALSPAYSEYVQTKLTSTMVSGKRYKISFFVSLGENSSQQINSLAIYLTNTLVVSTSTAILPIAPTLVETNTSLLNDVSNWQQVVFTYTATGNENYLTIGRPIGSPGSTTSAYTPVCSPPFSQSVAYLYIDDVSVTQITTPPPSIPCNVPTALNLTACNSGFGFSLFSWSPATGLSNPSILNPTITLINTTTYTLTQSVYVGSTLVASNSFPITFFVNSGTLTVNAAVSPTVVCPYSLVNLTATSNNTAATYVWNYNSYSLTGPNQVDYPASTSVYTINVTSPGGCTYVGTVQATVSNTVTVTPSANANNICAGNVVTLTATSNNASTTYTWYPGAIVGSVITVTPSSTTVYTLVGGTPSGCYASATLPINVSTNTLVVNTTISSATACPNNPIVLYGSGNEASATYTWYPGSLVGATQTVNPLGTTVYTVIGTSPSGCMAQASTTVNVYPNDPSFTYTVSNPFVCLPNNSSTVSLTNTVTSTFTITTASSPTVASSSIVLAPSVTTIYTITAYNSYGCIATRTIQIGVVDCACLTPAVDINSSPGYNVGYTSFGPFLTPFYAPYNFVNSLYFGGTYTFSNCEVRMYPNTEIRVANNGTLSIIGSHFYACGDMWKGIVVEPGGVLNIISSNTATPFIEDAYVAVDVVTFTASTVKPNILNIQDATFNRNQIGIRISDFAPNQTNYPFTIQNCLFTSRSIPYSNLTWTATSTIKNGASGNLSSLQTPYINGTTYPLAFLKSPLTAQTANNGMVISNVGWTSTNGNTWKGLTIGNNTNINKFNCFDLLREDVTITNSNVQLTNNVFQNGVRYGRGGNSGGKGIVANSITLNPDAIGAKNNQILIQSVGTTTNLGNRFYEKTAAADITGYINTIIENNAVYSFGNTYSNFNGLNPIGDHAFSLKTNRYYTMTMQKNKIYNIKNAMLISLDNGPYGVGTQGGVGRLVGNINVNTNIVDRHPTTAVASEFVNVGLSISDPFSASSTTIIGGGSSSNAIYSNKFTNVHNGISVSNIGFSAVNITTNTINMVNEPNTIFAFPVQNGIIANQIAINLSIAQNSIVGAPSYSSGVKGIATNLNSMLSVQCNTTSNLARGIEFNQGQTVVTFEDNRMQSETYGLVLDNNAVLTTSVLGSTTRPTNNVWLSTWTTPNYKTYTTGGSSAQNGKLYIQYGNTQLDPASSGLTTGNFSTDRYDYVSTSPITLLNVTTPAAIGCRIGSGGGGAGLVGGGISFSSSSALANTATTNSTSNSQAVMEQMATNSITYSTNVSETQAMNKILTYRSLKANPNLITGSSVLNNFYTASQTTNLQKAVAIEEDLMANNLSGAQSKISSYTPANTIETNYKLYYSTFLKTKTNTYASADSLTLLNLANLCPYTNGGVVYQARALYNMLYTGFYKYNDNCNSSANNSRIINNIISTDNTSQESVNVILKSKLYPNPNMGEFSIELTNKVEQTNVQICIFDNSGKQFVKEQKQITNGVVNCNYNLINGIYLVKVIMQDGSVDVHRLIINK